MDPEISIEAMTGTKYRVTIEEGQTKTVHEVTVTPVELEKYGQGATAEALLRASVEFLLQREPQESILSHFGLSDIARYFPDFPKKIRRSL